jgi:tRNA-specific 2-thiouridylase
MAFPLPIPVDLRRAVTPGASVLLALSGGVDSALALAMLADLGAEVVTVTFKNFCYGNDADPAGKSCCSLDAIDDARALAARFGARHWVTDVSDMFEAQVIAPFVREYEAARTPNPCLACNSLVRFPHLVRLADQVGCRFVATGHYARTAPVGEPGCRLLRGVDRAKDQAYFLSQVPTALLPRVLFPLGWSRKDEVRAAAAALDLSVARKPESQEICFVPTDDRTFLFDDAAPAAAPGEIVDGDDRVLGTHRGLLHYTVGQRRGLGIAAARPLYVLGMDLGTNRLRVGFREELAVTVLRADGFRPAISDFPAEGPPADGGSWTAQIRHRHAGATVRCWRWQPGGFLEVVLEAPVHGAAPGQALVLFAGEMVLGCGRLVAGSMA